MLIFKLLLTVTDCEEKGNSKLDWYQYNQKCYFPSPDVNSWQSAEAFCKQNGGFLVSIHNKNELFFLTSKVIVLSERISYLYSKIFNCNRWENFLKGSAAFGLD